MPKATEEIDGPGNPHFVWVKGLKGPCGQKWAVLYYGTNGRLLKDGSVLATNKLTEKEWGSPIDVLAKVFPAPVNYS